MNPNAAAKGALETYLCMERPGYALLVDSPWGSGKTFFVKKVCEVDSDTTNVRYVTLNGVSDEMGFRRALLKDYLQASLAEKGAILGDTVSKIFKLGDLGSLARDVVQEKLIETLPDTIIFDDIERADIGPQVLFGLINEFVEHKEKRVILLVHSEAHNNKDEFLKKREKLIGRTLHIVVNFEEAFQHFVSAMPSGKGKKYFCKHRHIAKEVFEQAGHQNLRLLRNAVRDCALVLDRVDDELFAAMEPMARFVKTYLALTMALAKGEIEPKDLANRNSYKIAISDDVEEELKPLNRLYNIHKGSDIFAGSGTVLPRPLDELLFVKGHVETEALNDLLKATGQFNPQEENPLWKRIIHWGDCGWDGLKELVDEGETYLFDNLQVEMGPFLHIADSMLHIQERGGLDLTRDELASKLKEQIQSLRESGKIPAAKFGRELGWSKRGGGFSFGGYGSDGNEEFSKVLQVMEQTQLAVYQDSIPGVAEGLLSNFEEDLEKFQMIFSYSNAGASYYDEPILHHLDMERFAAVTLQYLESGMIDDIGQVFDNLEARHHVTENVWDEERTWLKKLRCKLEERTAEHSKLAEAQLKLFLKFHWKFSEPQEGDG